MTLSFPPVALQAALLITVVMAGVYDARFRRIPNWVVLVGLALGFSLNAFLFEWQGLLMAAKGFGVGLLIYFPLYLIRAMGAGDAKLMAAVGCMLGPSNWFGVFILTVLLGAASGLVLLVVRKRLAQGLWNVGFLVRRLMAFEAPYATNEQLDVRSEKALRMPHGVVIAAACVMFLTAAWVWAPR